MSTDLFSFLSWKGEVWEQWNKTHSECDFTNYLYAYCKYIQLKQHKSSTVGHWLNKSGLSV